MVRENLDCMNCFSQRPMNNNLRSVLNVEEVFSHQIVAVVQK
jgi:hypothetical protein